jgi:guanylate kinase
MHSPNEYERNILDYNRSQAPQNGAAFHEQEDLQAFLETPPELYTPGVLVVERLCQLEVVATISGAFGVGKNGAKSKAVELAELPHPPRNVRPIHPVLNGTTRLPEYRDGHVEEDGIDYNFAFTYAKNRELAQKLREGKLVQYAQPRGDHVYFTDIDDFPERDIALMDTVPQTLFDLNRILDHAGKRAVGIYRTEDTFESWMARVQGRGDILNQYGQPIDMENYRKRMKEAAKSISEALQLRKELDICFFATESKVEAGKAVIDILTGNHSKEMQRKAEAGAAAMLRGLASAGFRAA